jgi:ATP-dependent helicase/nuclease subunit A
MLDAARRGRLLHALFERLPAVAPNAREAAAVRWLQHAAGVETESVRAELVSAACAIIADPRFAAIFGAEALAEAPIAAVVGEQVIAGTGDRLLVTDTVVRVVDFKTGRRVPATVEAALLYAAGPRLVPIPEALLARCKADLARVEEKLPLAR